MSQLMTIKQLTINKKKSINTISLDRDILFY